jgi:hypothetical protein
VFKRQYNSAWSKDRVAGKNIASLYSFEPIYCGSNKNTWDYALARYDNIADAEARMRACEEGTERPYPRKLSKDLSFKKPYWTVGNRPPTCATGTPDKISLERISYPGGDAWFENALVFSKMSKPGDSGSIIARESDNTVTGLLFAGNNEETIACPIYRAGWVPSDEASNGDDLPALEGTPRLTPRGYGPTTVDVESFMALSGGMQAATPDDLPSFEARMFLGTGTAILSSNGIPLQGLQSGLAALKFGGFLTPVPPRRHPDIEVIPVLLHAWPKGDFSNTYAWHAVYAFFG